jgi:hypothetical protein
VIAGGSRKMNFQKMYFLKPEPHCISGGNGETAEIAEMAKNRQGKSF